MAAKKFITLFVLLGSCAVFAQLPEEPKFLSKSNLAEMSAVATSLAADAESTQAILGWRLRELNPLIPHSRIGTSLYFGSAFAGNVAGVYLLRKHPWYHRAFNIALIGWEFRLASANYSKVSTSRRLSREPITIGIPACKDGCITIQR